MTLNAPLSVRVSDGTTDRHVTRYASDLSFTKVAPGGHQSCSFRLNLPRNTFGDLGPQDKCWIYGSTGGPPVFGAGYLENPTPVDGPDGQTFDVTAVGGMALANDESRSLVYVDQDPNPWGKDPFAAEAAGVETSTWRTDPTLGRVTVNLPGGGVVATNAYAGADYTTIRDAAMELGAAAVYCESGKSAAGWVASLVHAGGAIDIGGASTITTSGLLSNLYVGTDFPAGTDYVSLRLRRTGAPTNIADDTTWTDFAVILLGRRMDRYGSLLTGSAGMVSSGSVLASQVVEDLLGRLLTMCDPATAQIDTTTFPIGQLTYPDGVKAATVLTGLEQWEPEFWWGVHESGDNGLHRFGYRQWATEPRYVVSVKDGWRQRGSDVDLCNRIVVYYTDGSGRSQHVEVTAASLGLVGIGLPVDALGSRVKDADPITLPPGRGSAANAQQVGESVLRDKINPPLAGTITVRRPIVDLLTGNTVMPWELEPGWPVLVQEPGYSIRCTSVVYDDQSVASTLTLGRPVLTPEQRVAKLARASRDLD